MGIEACAVTPITPGKVTFDPAAFIVSFPAFASVPPELLSMYFDYATLLLENNCCGKVKDAPTRAMLLNLVTAHITALMSGVNGNPPQGVVGRIASATEGSVSVSTEMMAQSESASWWNQTPWGAMYWRMIAQYRTAAYIPPCGDGYPVFGWPL